MEPIQFVIVSTFAFGFCLAGGGGGGYGGGGGGGRSVSRAASIGSSGGQYSVVSLGGGLSGGYGGQGGRTGGGYGGGGGNNYGGGSIPAAIQTRHQIEFKDVPSTGNIQPAMIEVGANAIPLNILFRSASSSLNVLQQHQGANGDTQESSSEDEPHRLVHTVTKPIIQEVREVISPFRKITQEVQPVQEEIQTIVARNTGQQHPSSQQQYSQSQQSHPSYAASAPVPSVNTGNNFDPITLSAESLSKIFGSNSVGGGLSDFGLLDLKALNSSLHKSLPKKLSAVPFSSSSASKAESTGVNSVKSYRS